MGKFISNYDELPILNKKIYDLVQEKSDGNISAFADRIDVKQQVLDRLFKKDKRNGKYPSVSENIKKGIKDTFGIDELQLLTGKGSILNKPIQNEVTQLTIGGVMMVPLVNQYAQAGYMMGWADVAYIETLPKIPWIVDKEYKGKYISFEVRGDSMDDGMKHSYEQGDILLCREIGCDYWKSKLHINAWDAFVIVHKTDGIVLKQIVDHDVEKGIITCHSFNPIYPDFTVDLRDIAQLFNVVKQQKNK
jgi:hypothetical protein|nr:MAG TPA: repressor [Caudoviricetes sp.]